MSQLGRPPVPPQGLVGVGSRPLPRFSGGPHEVGRFGMAFFSSDAGERNGLAGIFRNHQSLRMQLAHFVETSRVSQLGTPRKPLLGCLEISADTYARKQRPPELITTPWVPSLRGLGKPDNGLVRIHRNPTPLPVPLA